MNTFVDIIKKDTENYLKKEDEAIVYNDFSKPQKIGEGLYNDINYTIMTNGFYPYIILEKNKETSGIAKYVCYFNTKEDYIRGKNGHEKGKKYSVDKLKKKAEKLIDWLDKTEKFIDYAMRNDL